MSEPKAKAGCGYAFMGAVIALGLFLLWIGARPAGPAQVTGRRIATSLGFGALAGGVLFLIPMRRALARQQAQAKLEADHPGQPWQWRPDWHAGRIAPAGGRAAAMLWFFALVWNLISWGSLLAAWSQLSRERMAGWLVLLFPLVGLLLLWAALYQTIRARKFGRPVFLPTGVPGVIAATWAA